MKTIYTTLTALMLAVSIPAAYAADNATKLDTPKQKISYSIGIDIGKNFKTQEIELDTQSFMQGLQDGHKGSAPLMNDEQIRATLMELQTQLMAKQATKMNSAKEENLAKGKTFLEQNKQKKDVVTLKSGLQYRVIKDGKGTPPTLTDKVKTHYRGTLVDGTEFDSSYKRGEPVEFAVGGVIKGWTEALQIMKPGSKWELYIPSSLAYGEQGAGNVIGPNSTLIFEIELLSVEKSDKKSS